MHRYEIGDKKLVIWTGEQLTLDEFKQIEDNIELFAELVKAKYGMISMPCTNEKQAEKILAKGEVN